MFGSYTVGTGIRTNVTAADIREDEDLQKLWQAWSKSTKVDFDCRCNFYKIQKQVIEAMAESGEVLIRKRIRTDDGAVLPLRLQVLESDFIATPMFSSGGANGNRIVQGIEFDSDGCVVAYHLYENHPGDFNLPINGKGTFSTNRVPAEEIIHLYDPDRPGQIRGVTWFHAAMIRMRDFDDYEDAQLMRQKIAACFSVFVRDAQELDDPLSETDRTALGEKVEPGMIEYLPPGKDITLANPPTVENYGEYQRAILHAIASGIGVSYEAMTSDYSDVNFSSARMAKLEFEKNLSDWRELLLNPIFNDRVFEWFVESAALMGLRSSMATATWIAPRRDMVDPTKEVPAKIKAIRAGIESLEDVVMQTGKDPIVHFEQVKETNKLLDSLGLVFDSDPRKTADDGDLHPTETNNEQRSLNGSGLSNGEVRAN